MSNNGLVRYDLQQGQQSTVQPHIEEPEVSRGSQIATALTQGFSQLLDTGIKFAASLEKDSEKQKKAQNLSEMYSYSAELRNLFQSGNMTEAQRTVEIDKFYSTGLSRGLTTNELNGIAESSGFGVMTKTTKDLLQNVEDTYKDQRTQDQNSADALFSREPDPKKRLDMYYNDVAATSNVQNLFNKLQDIDPEVQLEYVKSNYQQAMRVLVNKAFDAAYNTDQKNFTTETVQQASQAIRQELSAAGFTQASIDYFVGNEEIVWKKIAQTNSKNIDEAKQDVDNKNQYLLNSQFSSMASQPVEVMIGGKKQTTDWGTVATISKFSPDLAKTFAIQGLLNTNNASAILNGTTPKTPTVFNEENIKLVIGPNAKITQGIIDTPEGSGKEVLISMNKDGLGQTAEDLKKEVENIIATGEAGKESGRNNASLPMAAYRNATGNIQKDTFLKRPENEEKIFQEYSKLSAEYLQTLNGEKDLVMLYDESGRPRLYRVRVPQEVDTSAEALAKIPSTGDFMTDVVTNQAIKNYSEQPRKVTFEDVSNSEFFTRNFASAASQFLQDGITRTGQSKRDLIRQYNSLMMQNSAAAREWFKSETGSSADPSESWANDKVAEIRGGHYNTPNILQSNVSKKTSQGNTINLPQYSSEESDINIPNMSLENTEEEPVITTDDAQYVIDNFEDVVLEAKEQQQPDESLWDAIVRIGSEVLGIKAAEAKTLTNSANSEVRNELTEQEQREYDEDKEEIFKEELSPDLEKKPEYSTETEYVVHNDPKGILTIGHGVSLEDENNKKALEKLGYKDLKKGDKVPKEVIKQVEDMVFKRKESDRRRILNDYVLKKISKKMTYAELPVAIKKLALVYLYTGTKPSDPETLWLKYFRDYLQASDKKQREAAKKGLRQISFVRKKTFKDNANRFERVNRLIDSL